MDHSLFSCEHTCGSSLSIYGTIISDSDKWLRFLVSGVVCRHGQGTLDIDLGRNRSFRGTLKTVFHFLDTTSLSMWKNMWSLFKLTHLALLIFDTVTLFNTMVIYVFHTTPTCPVHTVSN